MTNNEESCQKDQQKSNSLDHKNDLAIKSRKIFKVLILQNQKIPRMTHLELTKMN